MDQFLLLKRLEAFIDLAELNEAGSHGCPVHRIARHPCDGLLDLHQAALQVAAAFRELIQLLGQEGAALLAVQSRRV
ncbi:MAG: hypothetical protein GEU75_06235 [Dehalococcoidia bacterium]|nr:hypothetical protein [Dehalococcoidia bacterium]